MDNDLTPINARPKRRPPEAVEDLSLALREHLLWPIEDRLFGLGDRGRAAVAGGAVVLALGLGIGGYSLLGSENAGPAETAPVAALTERAPHPAPTTPPAPEPEPEPTLHGAAPVFDPPASEGKAKVGASAGVESAAAPSTAANTGDPATDTLSSSPSARPADDASASTSTAAVDGPPAGPAAIAVARKFAEASVVYETGGEDAAVRAALGASATPELTKALMERPPRQPAGVEVPQAKVLNIVPAPSHGKVYPLSVSLLRVGVTSELRLEMEQLKSQGWRVTNVLG
ncbi:MAG TPA: hypothetical protein VF504_01405 [Solirubrobacterales bacterium]